MVSAPPVLVAYVHDLDPVLFRITESIALRWYGLAYLAAFVVAVVLLNRLSRQQRWVLPVGSAGDFIAAAAIFGVFLGGRLGYMLWYWPREHGWSWVTEDPLALIRVWEGGMASHGGILGLVVFTWFYARKKKVSWTGLGDGLCVVAPLGLMFGRIANFINGELYGRVADGVGWAMKFPNTLLDPELPESRRFDLAVRATLEVDEGFREWYAGVASERLSPGLMLERIKEAQRGNPEVSAALEPLLEPRHPSQLYQAALEGALLFAVLWFLRSRFPAMRNGILTGVFFIGYALLRIVGEQFREPDSALVGPLTSGQFLSLFMIAAGLAFIVAAKLGKTGVSAES
jgi:phosphatidylglycerol:prolipoprotein diacylglycerol transferase